MKTEKIDLSYLKALVQELEVMISDAEAAHISLPEEVGQPNKQYLINMCKAAGLCLGITQESSMLIGDINKSITQSFGPQKSKEDPINALLNNYIKPIKVN